MMVMGRLLLGGLQRPALKWKGARCLESMVWLDKRRAAPAYCAASGQHESDCMMAAPWRLPRYRVGVMVLDRYPRCLAMTQRFQFVQMDVFSSQLFNGNPLAVVIGADALDTDAMQRIARWTNLSETTFLLAPTQPHADYRVRIFTPRQELPFAGHPSVGSAYVAIEAGLVPGDRTSLLQECAAGLLPVRVVGDGSARIIHVQAPPASINAINDTLLADLEHALHVKLSMHHVGLVDNGPHWLVCDLGEGRFVRDLQPDMAAIAAICTGIGAVGVSVFGHESHAAAAMAVRAFCPADGIPEDPVTGSANAAIAAYLHASGGLAAYGQNYRASQGREVGRDGYVDVSLENGRPDNASIENASIETGRATISIGGACVIGVRGELNLD
jgi:PhzF family phenazine biosynthesis protein